MKILGKVYSQYQICCSTCGWVDQSNLQFSAIKFATEHKCSSDRGEVSVWDALWPAPSYGKIWSSAVERN